MAEKLEVVITAVDKASGVLGKITKTIGAGLLSAAGIGLGAIATGFGIAVNEAKEAEEAMAQLEAVLKSTGGVAGVTADAATDLADSLSKVTRFSDETILNGESLLLTFKNIGSDVFPDVTKAMLDMSTAMGQDIKTSALQLGKALNDPVAGLSALTRVGVTFSEEQKTLIESLVEMGDVAGAQKIILEELNSEFGGSAEAAGTTFAGQLDILRNEMLNLAETAGTQLLPLLTEGFQALAPIIVELATRFAEFLQSDEFKAWLAEVIVVVQEVAMWLGENVPKAIAVLSDFWTNTLEPALKAVWEFLSVDMLPIWQVLGELLGVTLGRILEALAAIWTNVLQPALETIWLWIKDNIIPIFEAWGKSIGGVKGFIDGVVRAIQTLIDWIGRVKIPDWMSGGGISAPGGTTNAPKATNSPYYTPGSGGTNYYNLNINSNASTENIPADFALMGALAGGYP